MREDKKKIKVNHLALLIFANIYAKGKEEYIMSWKVSIYNLIWFRNGDLFCIRCKLTFFQLCMDIFQLWFQLTTYSIILHIHRKNQHSMPIGLEMLSS